MQEIFPPLLIKKPSGPTSFDIIHKIRKITKIKKIGHTGTLDPLASGLLIVLIGKATKKQAEFQNLDKEYIVEITFGSTTDTYDSQGKVTNQIENEKLLNLTEEKIKETLLTFQGKQDQTVPPFSAVKVNGRRLYKQARREKIDPKTLPKRTITVFEIELLSFQKGNLKKPPVAKIQIHCSKGTYIRSLAHDLGQKLEMGAHISGLTRTKIGRYKLENAITIEKLQQHWKKELSK